MTSTDRRAAPVLERLPRNNAYHGRQLLPDQPDADLYKQILPTRPHLLSSPAYAPIAAKSLGDPAGRLFIRPTPDCLVCSRPDYAAVRIILIAFCLAASENRS